MSKDRLQHLFIQYFSGTSTAEENSELFSMIEEADKQELDDLITASWEKVQADPEVISAEQSKSILKTILRPSGEVSSPVIQMAGHRTTAWWKYLSGVAVLLLVFAGIFYMNSSRESIRKSTPVAQSKTDLPPGQNGAILTLANGKKIVLDSAGNGVLATQGSIQVVHANGQLHYQPGSDGYTPDLLNTVTTPKGRQYQLVLSDGSKVWLNAASSITYPMAFNKMNRDVLISGEVYFEIAAEKRPFTVNIDNKGSVAVLGTHFNINAYSDEPSINTTLLEGRIKITSAQSGQSKTLLPGQQAQLKDDLQLVNDIDINQVMAWKNGYFSFDGASTEAIMRQVQRWYDAEVVYEGDVKNERFAGSVPRSENASKLLEVLELTKTLKFTIEGKRILVKPYE